MIPIRLKIDGFLSYFEPVELEFDQFDLACISGSNGAGKSSLLDAITWVLFGKARSGGDAIINNRSESAEVVLDFAYEGSVYRVQRQKRKDKSTQLELFIQTDALDWKALTEHTVSETEKRISETLRMDFDTFTNASFFLQGKADQFAQQRPADRKHILGNILGLERWEEYLKRANLRRKGMEQEQAILAAEIEDIDRELAEEEERKANLKQKEELLANAETALKEKQKSIDVIRSLAASLNAQKDTVALLQKQYEGSQNKLDEIKERIQLLSDQQEKLQVTLEKSEEIEKNHSEWKSATLALTGFENKAREFHVLDGKKHQFDMEISNENSRLLSEHAELQKAEKKIKALKDALPSQIQRLEAIKNDIINLDKEIAGKDELEQKIKAIQEDITRHKSLVSQLKDEIGKAENKIKNIESTSEPVCPLCGQSLTAEHRRKITGELNEEIAQKQQQISNVENEIVALEKDQSNLNAEKEKIQKAEGELLKKNSDHARQETTVTENQRLIAEWTEKEEVRFGEVSQYLNEQNFAVEARRSLSDLNNQIDKLGYDSKAHEELRKRVNELAGSEAQNLELERARAGLKPLTNNLAEQKIQEANLLVEVEKARQEFEKRQAEYTKSAASQPDLALEEAALKELTMQENELRAEKGAARQRVDILEQQKTRRQEKDAELKEIRNQITTMKSLERAFGKDGIPALLIEEALPDIEIRANDILDRLSSGAMSVRFETQKDLKTREEKKETLDIVISDGAGQRAYEMYSGGEAFRVNFAIRLALSHLLAQRAGARLQTLVIDEGFGSQDADGRQKLIEAINMVKSDYKKILVITHLEELKDAFPARIEVEKTNFGSQVKVVVA